MLYPLDYLSKVYINILAKKVLLEQNYFMMRFLHFLSLYKKLAQCLFCCFNEINDVNCII
jgi:hypothetical protein